MLEEEVLQRCVAKFLFIWGERTCLCAKRVAIGKQRRIQDNEPRMGQVALPTEHQERHLKGRMGMRATLRCAKCSNAARRCYPVACVAGFAFGAAAFLLRCFCCDAGVCSHLKFRAFTFRLSMCRSGTYMSRGRAT